MTEQHTPDAGRVARWRERRRAKAQRRRESQEHRPPDANETRLRAEADLSNAERGRSYGNIFGGSQLAATGAA